MHYAETWRSGVVWLPCEPFRDNLTLLGFNRGRSAAYAEWQSDGGSKYPMFLKDLEHLLLTGAVVLGQATHNAEWKVAKRGQNYGIAFNGTGAS